MRLLLIGLMYLAAACTKESAGSAAPISFCHAESFEGSRFTVCNNQHGELRLFAALPTQRPLRTFAEVARQVDARLVAFAMNAGMFDQAGRPIGQASMNGSHAHALNLNNGSGNFHLKPNGVFMVTCGGLPAIYQSDAIPAFRCAPRLTTQSGPLLVINGKLHPKIDPDGPSRLIRNGVGVTANGEALFVIADSPVSFGRLARFFRDRLKTPNALYFDGVVSSLWDPASFRMDAHDQLGPIIVALKPVPKK